MTILDQILKNKIVAIIRGADPADVLKIAEALQLGGVNILEVTLNSQNAIQVIKELTGKMKNMFIGAGTVLSAADAELSIEAGAKFIISPNVNIETITTTKKLGIVSIPGAYTATEVVSAWSNGGDIIKIFPATNADYIKVLRGPLSQIPMMPTGGITPENISEFKKAGAVAFGIGTSLVDVKNKITVEYLNRVTENARKFVKAISE
ncbi:MAG TPA: bifunctional 4-hydroxy-2-oxoglutarate aldolase/2-dehydro-3-deoxy-phosphogluconate aldolase [Chitinophagaceae bacterium]|jgi:2-dehydro-3-deoxyphosphogluconate aldolase / (4S)-4-hydroxy-2-oxoglutarate aldolase|nr:bifunctional 4-hydroxy-2-oxoglutarate aldolase/2-dehydro-3-deoxy-phosphogluconate aldolase [Chitinophagaceae bacterium]